ncbi:hypothetical protein [Nostoc sp. UHCC 0870]|uniref:hypothetical protein n=1 Tax=Nostoc sp. UHCC 0870 TaxID=2914041 RepID=UPI001EDFD360|nr:hypothetical protein [Nostoc sp. UHCC 0870]UKP01593.1 hypothetical protein L6494_30795 [Nostoc sp. UHCC 0870]
MKLPDTIAKALEDYTHWYEPFVTRNPKHKLAYWMSQNWQHAVDHNIFPNGALMPKGVQREIREAFLSSFEPQALEAKVTEFLTTTPQRTLTAIASIRKSDLSDRKKLDSIWQLCDRSSLEPVLLEETEWLRGCIEQYHAELNPKDKQPLYVPPVDPKMFTGTSFGFFAPHPF